MSVIFVKLLDALFFFFFFLWDRKQTWNHDFTSISLNESVQDRRKHFSNFLGNTVITFHKRDYSIRLRPFISSPKMNCCLSKTQSCDWDFDITGKDLSNDHFPC